MSRKQLIAGNWKMFKTGAEAGQAAQKLADLAAGIREPEIMIAPAFPSLPIVAKALEGSGIKTGAQNLFHENEGAYTGEVSGPMIRDTGASYVIIGHSERRQYFMETDVHVNKKIRSAFQAGLTPVMCIGESETERDEKKTFSVLDKQVSNGLKDFRSDEIEGLVVAYEPVWAIGTGKTATTDQVQEVHGYVRSLIAGLFGNFLASGTRILYGGSVKPDNIRSLMELKDVDGALVGGASLDPEKFIKIVQNIG
ncbi:MAG: triose-phosphate isomerase [Thermodesulfobacteriota bacterium]